MTIISAESHPKLYQFCSNFAHKGHEACHAMYLGLVFVESHGFYGKAAGAMLVLLLVGWAFPDKEEGGKKHAPVID